MTIVSRTGVHGVVTAFIVAACVAGCGWLAGTDRQLGKLDEVGVGRALLGTWHCTEIYMVEGLDPGEYTVTFASGSGGATGGRYTTKSEGAGAWSILEANRDPGGEYFVILSMKREEGEESAGKGGKVADLRRGEWDIGSMTLKSFVRRGNGVVLKYRRVP